MTRFLRVRVLGHDVRVAVRPGTAPGPPLVLCNGIGASLDLLQPFVDEVDPRIEVVRFDVPGVGGSPLPKVPYNFALLACLVGRLLDGSATTGSTPSASPGAAAWPNSWRSSTRVAADDWCWSAPGPAC